MEIKKVVVIGSGTMGSGIAAHLCNAGVPVTLLDLTTEISEKARERIHKSRPPLLIDKRIKQVATARIVGLSCSLKPVHICIGIVVFSKPAKNSTTTTSSKDVTNANNPPEITPGNIKGSVIFINVLTGLLPKLAAALVTL